MSQPQPWYPPTSPPQPAKSNTTLILVIVLIVVVVVGVIGAIAAFTFVNYAANSASNLHVPRTTNIVNGLITVPAGGYEYYPFTLAIGTISISVSGSFTASGGSGNDIDVFVMDQTNFINWQNGHQSYSYFDSGVLTTGSVSASLPGAGNYYLVYSNTFSTVSSKDVQTSVNVYYTS